MVACRRLRIDCGDGSAALDYRIEDGCVEMRIVERPDTGSVHAGGWRRLSMDQLNSHVKSNSIVARWLQRRMGMHRLLRACNDFESSRAA